MSSDVVCRGSDNNGHKHDQVFNLQQWTLQGTQIISKYNSYCLSAGAQPCGRWADCNKAQAQTSQEDQILNVFAEPCSTSNPAQQWTLGPAPNSSLLNYTVLLTSASKYAPPNTALAALAYNNSRQVSHLTCTPTPLRNGRDPLPNTSSPNL